MVVVGCVSPLFAQDPYGIIIKPIPDKSVVLTFDDACLSHATFVAPLLKEYGFGGSFYITTAFEFNTRKDWHMTWEQIKDLYAIRGSNLIDNMRIEKTGK
jgi:peptidoglycan/xylan/chitin deacetylase (PgdA/CDA1 family)